MNAQVRPQSHEIDSIRYACVRTFVPFVRTLVNRTFVTYDYCMTDNANDVGGTEVGQVPATGGRVKKYADGAERAKAWRARQAERRAVDTAPTASSPTGRPELAVASLAAVLPLLKEATAQQTAAFSALAGRIEAAVELLSDPAAIDERLELARAESAKLVAEAQDQAAAAKADASRARSAEQALRVERDEATESAAQAWERVTELETRTTEAEEVASRLRADHATHLAEVNNQHAVELDAQAALLRKTEEDYDTALAAERAASARAEDRADVLNTKLMEEQQARIDDAHKYDRQREAITAELSRARIDHAAALERTRSEGEQRQAIAVAQVKEACETRLADRDERLDDLRSQLTDLRTERDRAHAELAAALARESRDRLDPHR